MRALVLAASIAALVPVSGLAQTMRLPPIRATFGSSVPPAAPVLGPSPFGAMAHGMPTLDPSTFVAVPGMHRTASPEGLDCAMVLRTHRNVDPNMPVVQPPPNVEFTMRVQKVLPCKQ